MNIFKEKERREIGVTRVTLIASMSKRERTREVETTAPRGTRGGSSLAFKYVSHPPPGNLLWRGRYAHIVLSLLRTVSLNGKRGCST